MFSPIFFTNFFNEIFSVWQLKKKSFVKKFVDLELEIGEIIWWILHKTANMWKIVSYMFNKLICLFSESIWRKSVGKTRPWRSLLARKDSYRTRLLWKNGKFLIHLSCCKGFLLFLFFPNTDSKKLFVLIFFKWYSKHWYPDCLRIMMQVLIVYSVSAIFCLRFASGHGIFGCMYLKQLGWDRSFSQ